MDYPFWPVKIVAKGGWLGIREASRGIRMLHLERKDWTDNRNGNYGAVMQRQIKRERLKRQWGGWWAKGLAVQSVAERLNEGQMFDLLDPKSPQELREYNQWAVGKIYEAAELLIGKIQAQGPGGPYQDYYELLNHDNADVRGDAQRAITSMCMHDWHRFEQYEWFRRKIASERKIAKKMEKKYALKHSIQIWFKALHNINDNDIPEIVKLLMKLIGRFTDLV